MIYSPALSGALGSRQLKIELQTELHDARIIGCGSFPKLAEMKPVVPVAKLV
jgi:hypothetical protein